VLDADFFGFFGFDYGGGVDKRLGGGCAVLDVVLALIPDYAADRHAELVLAVAVSGSVHSHP
jgi:hypothetical protein